MFDSALAGAAQQPQLRRRLLLAPIALQYADAELAMAAAGATSSAVAIARATHVLQWLLEGACDGSGAIDDEPGTAEPSNVPQQYRPYVAAAAAPPSTVAEAAGTEAVMAARAGFGAAVGGWVYQSLHEAGSGSGSESMCGSGGQAAAAAAAVAAHMLYEVLSAARSGGSGMEAALAAFKNTVGSAETAGGGGGTAAVRRSAAHEWLRLRMCRLLVSEQQRLQQLRQQQRRRDGGGGKEAMTVTTAVVALPPSAVRNHLTHSLSLYPHNPELLSALEVSEQLGHANLRLRQALLRAMEAGPSPQLLAACLRAEAGRVHAAAVVVPAGTAGGSSTGSTGGGGMAMAVSALERLLEKAATVPSLAASPLTWLFFIRCGAGRA